MGDVEFATREAAAAQLKASGPEVIPVLQRYAAHEDPEIRARVSSVLRSFAWMWRGAIVNGVLNGSTAQRAGVKPGDVIVKVDDTDVDAPADVDKLPAAAKYTFYVWRAGRVLKLDVAGGRRFGVSTATWDIEKGGNDHARGLTLLQGGENGRRAAEAYARLVAARAAGMDDRYAIGLLACLAAHELDHAYSMACYRAYCEPDGGSCQWTHLDMDERMLRLPFDSPHSAHLLEQYRTRAWSPELYHELEDWFVRHGRNVPMAREVLGKPWPADAGAPNFRAYDLRARLAVLFEVDAITCAVTPTGGFCGLGPEDLWAKHLLGLDYTQADVIDRLATRRAAAANKRGGP
jgi:hypothetical protein